MVGLQWCKECDGPRFKWQVEGFDDMPEVCVYCRKGGVEFVAVDETLRDLRRKLGNWARGGASDKVPGWKNRRARRVLERFDRTVGYWNKLDDLSPEIREVLREYHNRGRPQAAHVAPNDPPHDPNAPRLDPQRLHALVEALKAQAERDQQSVPPPKPAEPAPRGRSWGIFNRPLQQPKDEPA